MRVIGSAFVCMLFAACGSSKSDASTDAGPGDVDASTDAGPGVIDASTDAGPGVIQVACETAVASDGKCSIREAIANAVDGKQTHVDCAAGTMSSTVVLPSACTFELAEIDNGEPPLQVGACSADRERCEVASDCLLGQCDTLNHTCELSFSACNEDLDCVQTCDQTEVPALGNALPLVTGTIVIEGNGSTVARKAGAAAMRFFEVAKAGSLTLKDLTLAGGSTPGDGGAILVHGALTLEDGTIEGSSAQGDGGAIAAGTEGCRIIVTGSTFDGCQAVGDGGAIQQNDCVVEVDQTTFVRNSSETAGGALNCNAGAAACTVARSTFIGNAADTFGGGAISFFNDGPKTVAQGTFQGNASTAEGGALMAFSGAVTVAFSTFSGNTADVGGGAIFGDAAVVITGSIFEKNVDVAGDAPDLAGGVTSGGYNQIASTPSGFTAGMGDVTGTSADLNPLADNGGPTQTMAPPAGSAVVDAVPAGSIGCGTTYEVDQRGNPRPGSGAANCDKGAVEL